MTTLNNDQSTEPLEPDVDEYHIAAAEGIVEAERLLRSRTYTAVDAVDLPSRGWIQFTIGSLLIVTGFMSIGLSGATWMPAPIFAGIVGFVALFAMIWTSRTPPETSVERAIFLGITLAYIIACVAAWLA